MKQNRVENISQIGRDVERCMEHVPSTSTGGVRDISRVVSVSNTQVQTAKPTFEVISDTELCGFCHEPALRKDFDNLSKLFQTLRNQFMSSRNEDEREFARVIPSFCPPCKKLATQLWECDKLIRKTLEKAERVKTKFEKRVVDDILSDPEFHSTTQLPLPEKQKGLVQLKNSIFENYRKKLRVKKFQKLPSSFNTKEGPASSNTLVSCDNSLPDNHTSTQPKTCGNAGAMIGTGTFGSHEHASATYNEQYSCREVTSKEYISFTSNTTTKAGGGGDGGSLETRRAKTNFSCIFCAKSLKSKSGLMHHLHSHTGEKPICCFLCNKTFGHKSTMMNHLRIHTGEKPFKCNLCSKRFCDKSNLTVHSRIHTGERPFKCTICSKRFVQKGDLTYHSRIHSGEKPFKCNLCSKRFGHKSYLTAHSRIHSGEKPFKCNVCNKSFNQKSTLTTHSRIHTGKKPFKCSVCNKTFRYKLGLITHYKSHTGDRPFQCHVCCKTFSYKSNLNAHKKIHETKP